MFSSLKCFTAYVSIKNIENIVVGTIKQIQLFLTWSDFKTIKIFYMVHFSTVILIQFFSSEFLHFNISIRHNIYL